jgi:AraC-like DNA-binding protein
VLAILGLVLGHGLGGGQLVRKDTRPHWLRRAVDAAYRGIGSPRLDLATLAAAARAAPSTFAHRFRAAMGEPPRRFLTRIRCERARQLLENRPDLTIKEIARQCGHRDPLHFSRVFRRMTGHPPTRYRNAAQAVHDNAVPGGPGRRS